MRRTTMQLDAYVPEVLRTESHVPDRVYQRLAGNAAALTELNTAMGLFIEGAKRLDTLKKFAYYGRDIEFDATEETVPVPEGLTKLQVDRYSRLFHAVIGMCTEAGELLEAMDDLVFNSRELDEENVFEELGDGQWYFALGCDALGFDPCLVLERNIAKLRARYPDKFTMDAALNRDLDKEKSALLGKDV
ncbi:MAG: hypothetical protein JSS66_07055 [Armatimonadetes bacterium]|nr:hypothetical protein [Armatimonadota bacterium]